MAYDYLFRKHRLVSLATVAVLIVILSVSLFLSISSSTGSQTSSVSTSTILSCPNCGNTSSGVTKTNSTFTSSTLSSSILNLPITYCQLQSCFNQQDYQLWVQPYLPELEKIREVLMTPYTLGTQHYGYDSTFGLIRGGNTQASPAIGVSRGYNDAIVAIDNNLEGSYSLDYFNSAQSVLSSVIGFQAVNTSIYSNLRAILSKTWLGIGGCSIPFTTYSYPSSFQLLDRREAEYGFIGPYASTIVQPGNHLGGIGSNCGTSGQTWYLQNYDLVPTSETQPLIVTAFPSNQPINSTGGLESLSFYIDQMYMQCVIGTSSCSLWQSAYLNAMSQYPFPVPRQALHFIQVTRATQAWTMSNMTFNGVSAMTMLQGAINQVFSNAVGPNGGLYQNYYGTGSDQTPEPNFQAMVAFDPRMPLWFEPHA